MESLRKEFKIYNEDTTIIGLNNELKAMYSDFCLKKTKENIVFVTDVYIFFQKNMRFSCFIEFLTIF